MPFTLNVNGESRTVDAPEDKPLLWVLREDLGLTGTKYGCGIARCGACPVSLDGKATRSCRLPVSSIGERPVVTIEGLGELGSPEALAVRNAWRELDVVQCGFCQSGQIMSATSLLADNPDPGDEDIDRAMRGNLCRCGTYQRIRAAIRQAADEMKG